MTAKVAVRVGVVAMAKYTDGTQDDLPIGLMTRLMRVVPN